MLEGAVRESFERQAEACRALGSSFTSHVCRRLIEILDETTRTGARVVNWPGDPVEDALALRLCGGLHYLVLSASAKGLAALYPPADVRGAVLDAALRDVLEEHDAVLHDILSRAPQTNEVGRSGVLLGILLTIVNRTGKALDLLEIGASAGLNLWPDCWRYRLGNGLVYGQPDAALTLTTDWRGNLPETGIELPISGRAGCDLDPIDPSDPGERLRLLSYIWPDQPGRLSRARAALEFVSTSDVRVEKASAEEWLRRQLMRPGTPGVARVVLHSIMWQYLPPETRARIELLMGAAGAISTTDMPLAWARLEHNEMRGRAELLLTMWPGGRREHLGTADYHGQWAEWKAG